MRPVKLLHNLGPTVPTGKVEPPGLYTMGLADIWARVAVRSPARNAFTNKRSVSSGECCASEEETSRSASRHSRIRRVYPGERRWGRANPAGSARLVRQEA